MPLAVSAHEAPVPQSTPAHELSVIFLMLWIHESATSAALPSGEMEMPGT